jgi:hypothetical protein
VLSSSFVEDGLTLSSVFSEAAVNEVDKIVSDWNVEDTWHNDGATNGGISLVDGDNWSRGHLFIFN